MEKILAIWLSFLVCLFCVIMCALRLTTGWPGGPEWFGWAFLPVSVIAAGGHIPVLLDPSWLED
jgi:hypothetical protein